MIRFSLHGPPPRGVRGEPVHGIVSRSTLYGIHRPIMRPDLDVHCSKTTLLFFTNRGAANMFASRFLQKNPALRRPWRLESMPFEDLQKICLLNYLDTYLCFHASQATAAAFEAGRAGAGSGAGSGAVSGVVSGAASAAGARHTIICGGRVGHVDRGASCLERCAEGHAPGVPHRLRESVCRRQLPAAHELRVV